MTQPSADSAYPQSLPQALEAHGLSQRGLARLLGLTSPAVHYWCAGKSSPGGPARRMMASVLSVPLEVVDAWFGSVTRL